MQLLGLSLSHHNTPVELRECLSLPADRITEVYPQHPVHAQPYDAIEEMVILSTCNRVEVYAVTSSPLETEEDGARAFQPLLAYLQSAFSIPVRELEPYFRYYQGSPAVEHLFRVASGLDSLALGETQVLGQVSSALEVAIRLGSARHVLPSVFRSAIHTGKRVHSETLVGRRPTSIASIAVRYAREALGELDGKRALVIGAGKMGQLALQALQETSAAGLVLTSRTREHAAELAGRQGCALLPFEELAAGIAQADLAFVSTSSAEPILTRGLLSRAMRQRRRRPLLLVDLAVPRNVDPAVTEVPGVRLADMDDLQAYVHQSQDGSASEIAAANAIISEEWARYEHLLRIIPFIGELHKKIEEIRQHELDRALKNLKDPGPRVSEQFELFSRSLVRKILHEPTMHLRTETNQETLNDYVDALTRLFDLSDAGTIGSLEGEPNGRA